MKSIDSITTALRIEPCWVVQGGVLWLTPQDRSIREVAAAMNAVGARFITITAYEDPGAAGMRLEYHWDLEGHLLGVPFNLQANSIESIYDICEAADWIEREVHEGFAIDFTGRAYEPLLLRAGATAGVNLHEEPR